MQPYNLNNYSNGSGWKIFLEQNTNLWKITCTANNITKPERFVSKAKAEMFLARYLELMQADGKPMINDHTPAELNIRQGRKKVGGKLYNLSNEDEVDRLKEDSRTKGKTGRPRKNVTN